MRTVYQIAIATSIHCGGESKANGRAGERSALARLISAGQRVATALVTFVVNGVTRGQALPVVADVLTRN